MVLSQEVLLQIPCRNGLRSSPAFLDRAAADLTGELSARQYPWSARRRLDKLCQPFAQQSSFNELRFNGLLRCYYVITATDSILWGLGVWKYAPSTGGDTQLDLCSGDLMQSSQTVRRGRKTSPLPLFLRSFHFAPNFFFLDGFSFPVFLCLGRSVKHPLSPAFHFPVLGKLSKENQGLMVMGERCMSASCQVPPRWWCQQFSRWPTAFG